MWWVMHRIQDLVMMPHVEWVPLLLLGSWIALVYSLLLHDEASFRILSLDTFSIVWNGLRIVVLCAVVMFIYVRAWHVARNLNKGKKYLNWTKKNNNCIVRFANSRRQGICLL